MTPLRRCLGQPPHKPLGGTESNGRLHPLAEKSCVGVVKLINIYYVAVGVGSIQKFRLTCRAEGPTRILFRLQANRLNVARFAAIAGKLRGCAEIFLGVGADTVGADTVVRRYGGSVMRVKE